MFRIVVLPGSVRRWKPWCIGAAILTAAGAAPANANMVTLQDGNAVVKVDTSSDAGLFSFKVNGIEQATNESFYYRIRASGPEHPIGTLTQTNISVQDGDPSSPGNNLLHIDYSGSGFTLGVTYNLTGGSGPSLAALAETVQIDNTSRSAPLDLHFFEYDHFTPDGLSSGNTATFTNGNTADVTGRHGALRQVVASPDADHHQVGLNGGILASLQDGQPTTLTDVSGPVKGDAEFAYQWDRSIAPQGSFQISKVKTVTPAVPLPPAVWSGLAMLAGLGLIAGARRVRHA